jgi:hypothetical protein
MNHFLLFIVSESFHIYLVEDTRGPKPRNFTMKRMFFQSHKRLGVVGEVFFFAIFLKIQRLGNDLRNSWRCSNFLKGNVKNKIAYEKFRIF